MKKNLEISCRKEQVQRVQIAPAAPPFFMTKYNPMLFLHLSPKKIQKTKLLKTSKYFYIFQ